MRTIIVATDFSTAALNAANYAADMALAIDADIALLHVYHIPAVYSDATLATNLGDMQRLATRNMNELKDQLLLNRKGRLNISIEIVLGNFFQELKTFCESINPYLVVLGSQGTTAADRLLFGGHTVHAMKKLEWPLITVPVGVSFSSIKKICVACDFEDMISNLPMEEIKEIVSDFHAELHILNTSKKRAYNPEIIISSGLLKVLMAPIVPYYHFIESDDTDEAIMAFAEEKGVDLLIVLPKRHALLDKIIHSSHTKQMVFHSHVPVMALHHL